MHLKPAFIGHTSRYMAICASQVWILERNAQMHGSNELEEQQAQIIDDRDNTGDFRHCMVLVASRQYAM